MTRDKAKELIQQIKDIMSDIDLEDTDETEIWTIQYWILKDMIDDLEGYYD